MGTQESQQRGWFRVKLGIKEKLPRHSQFSVKEKSGPDGEGNKSPLTGRVK